MNDNTLLISYKTVVENSTIGSNYNPQVIRTLIKEVQEMHVAEILGKNLYKKLKNDVANDSLTGTFKDLVNDKLKPVFIYGILENLPFAGNYQFSNSGLLERTAENSNNVDPKELQKISDYYKAKRVFYAGKVTEFICEHQTEIDAINEGQYAKDQPKKQQYKVGIYLG